jgi:hypothetical protein
MAGKWTGSVAVNRRLRWRTDQATGPEYSSAKVRRDWAFTPSGFAEGSIEVEPGVRIGMVTGKGAILDLEIGVDVKFTATERVEAKAEPSGETVEAEISLGVSMGVTAKLHFLEPVFPAAGMDLDVWDHPIKTWSYTLKKADLNTRVPGYSHAQVDRALNDVLRGSLLNGYRSVSDEAVCADPRRTCEFTTANGGRTNGFSAVASPNELVTLKATAYPSEQAARNAAARAARELSAAIGDGSFDIPPSEVRTVGPDGRVRKIRAHYGARGKGTVLAGIQASDWTGDGILRQYDDVPTARVREKLKHLGCTTRQLALARGCLWPASWQDNWMVVTKHNVVLKGRFRQPGPDRSTNTQYLSRLTLIMADFAHQIGAPTGAAGY